MQRTTINVSERDISSSRTPPIIRARRNPSGPLTNGTVYGTIAIVRHG